MKKATLLILAVVLALVVAGFEPVGGAFTWTQLVGLAASGTPVPLTITNPLPKAVVVDLTGPKKYTISVPSGQSITKNIDKGAYKYKYNGCLNKPTTGQLKFKAGAFDLQVKQCKMAKWAFYNADDTYTWSANFKGWVNYNVSVPPGQIKSFDMVADSYQVKENWCGKPYEFTWKVQGKKGWTIRACP